MFFLLTHHVHFLERSYSAIETVSHERSLAVDRVNSARPLPAFAGATGNHSIRLIKATPYSIETDSHERWFVVAEL